MPEIFDDLASILKSSPSPYDFTSKTPKFEGFTKNTKPNTGKSDGSALSEEDALSKIEQEGYASLYENDDYISLDHSDYAIYSETSKETPYKTYTVISQHSYPEYPIPTSWDGFQDNQTILVHNDPAAQDEPDEPYIKDIIVSKQFEESYMSTTNKVYIGSLTIIGLYVLFRYLKD